MLASVLQAWNPRKKKPITVNRNTEATAEIGSDTIPSLVAYDVSSTVEPGVAGRVWVYNRDATTC